MHDLGFEVQRSKGTTVDGHDREYVVEYYKMFLQLMVAMGFLNEGNSPTEEARKAVATDHDLR